jgi:hypothetical protein
VREHSRLDWDGEGALPEVSRDRERAAHVKEGDLEDDDLQRREGAAR